MANRTTPDHIGQLTPDPRNARRHTPRNVGMIEAALRDVGAGRSIVLDEDNVILAGNATVEAAAQAGIVRVVTVDADGETFVAVRRSGLTPEQKTRLALFDNRAAELAEWDPDVLKGLQDELDLSGLWYDGELAGLLATGDVFDADLEWGGMPEFSQDDRTAIKQISVSFYREEDVTAFGRLIGQPVTMQTRGVNFPIPGRERPTGASYRDGPSNDEA